MGPKVIHYCRTYFTDRLFRMEVDHSLWAFANAVSVVSQGSCLNLILYIIYSIVLKLLFEGVFLKCKVNADDLKMYTERNKATYVFVVKQAINYVVIRAKNGKVFSTSKRVVI